MKSGRNRRTPMAEINVVPYIDVMLVLLLIFMITTPLLSRGVEVDLPQTAAEMLSGEDKEPIILSVDARGQFFLNISNTPNDPMTPQNIMEQVSAELQTLAQTNQPQQVLVKGDQSVDYGQVMEAMVLLQQAGAASVGLITAPIEEH